MKTKENISEFSFSNLRSPDGFSLQFHSNSMCIIQAKATGEKVIILRHDDIDLGFAQINFQHHLHEKLEKTWLFQSKVFKMECSSIASTSFYGNHQNVNVEGHLALTTCGENGGYIILVFNERYTDHQAMNINSRAWKKRALFLAEQLTNTVEKEQAIA